MHSVFLILLVGLNNSYSGSIGYHFGFWDNWKGNGLKTELAYGLSGKRLGIDFGIDFSKLSFTKEGESFSFNDFCFGINPNIYISPDFPLKIGVFLDYTILFGEFCEKWDTTKYPIKTLYLPGYGMNMKLGYPITEKFSLGLHCQYKTIYRFKNLNIFCLGFLLEYRNLK